MITIILFALFGLFIAIKSFWDEYDFAFVDIVVDTLMTFLIIILATFIGLGVAIMLPMKTVTKVDTYNIVCLQDNNSTNGNFFLGSGTIQGEMKYVFYYEENETYKMKQTNYYNTSIKYSETAKVERYRQEKAKAFINYFAIDILSENNMQYIIYVPKGTIKNNYALDAQ
ncbi:hypothetical protein M0Q97_03715 [Candidatus Dojkabacteria bacterium]|jgi:hypothetical protein|nr:hypothetical protein [Candidatus Dojkabacteria bacterium]